MLGGTGDTEGRRRGNSRDEPAKAKDKKEKS
jgi:hypothetical protein